MKSRLEDETPSPMAKHFEDCGAALLRKEQRKQGNGRPFPPFLIQGLKSEAQAQFDLAPAVRENAIDLPDVSIAQVRVPRIPEMRCIG